MNTVSFSINENIPVIAETDVLVVGGGPGGLGAAVMAARTGANVILIERYGMLGGMASFGEVTPFMWNHQNIKKENGESAYVSLDRPVYREWIRKMADYLPDEMKAESNADVEAGGGVSHIISRDIAPMAMEELLLEAGVKILYHHDLVKTQVSNGHIEYAIFSSKSGFVAVKARNFIDCTGDGDLAVLAGAPFELGGPSGYCQPMTLCFKLSHVDKTRLPNGETLQKLYLKAKEDGVISCPRENVLSFNYYDDDVVHFNTTRVIKRSAVNGLELSEAELEGHRQFREFFRWLRSTVPGFENARVRSIASHIGVRESRRILGRAYIGRPDFEKHAKFPDGIARCNYSIDIHNPDGSGTELVYMPNTVFYEIPYGCIIPQGLDNLAVGGRSISVDHALHSSSRVMPPVCSVGQAAGVAAALSVKSGVALPNLDGVAVRTKLREMGANL